MSSAQRINDEWLCGMTKLQTMSKWSVIASLWVAGLIYINRQSYDNQIVFGLYALMLYLAYCGNQRIEQLKKETLYDCTFEKEIIAADSDEVITRLEVNYRLPFPPYIGLQVAGHLNPMAEDCDDYDNHDFQSFHTDNVITVVWYYSRFTCKVEPHKMTAPDKIEDVICAYSEYAWRISDVYLIYERDAILSHIDEAIAKCQTAQDESSRNRCIRLKRVRTKMER